MTTKVIKIERVSPRDGIPEEPEWGARGYCLGDPQHGSKKHHTENAVFVKTLDEVAEFVSRGFSLRMTRKGKRGSLVSPSGLRIIRG
jgi:hypothetical protein